MSPQPTYDGDFSNGKIENCYGDKFTAIECDYMGMISPNLLRRMGKSIRMGIGTAVPLLNKNSKPDAIIMASAEGGLDDCFKFLNQIVNYQEGTLAPTNFVQSTPNALAGNLALINENNQYNITHVHKGLAFESAVVDAMLLFKENKAESVLLGNVEEFSVHNNNIEKLGGYCKEGQWSCFNLFDSNTSGYINGEGAAMFYLEKQAKSYLAEIVDVEQISNPDSEDIDYVLTKILDNNKIEKKDIDVVILGKNGDINTDSVYDNFFTKYFSDKTAVTYKELVGEYPTAVGFAVFLGTLLVSNTNPEFLKNFRLKENANNVLIYNHFKGVQHSFILLRK